MANIIQSVRNFFRGYTAQAPEEVKQLNPAFADFQQLDDNNDVIEHSVINRISDSAQSKAGFESFNNYKDIIYGKLSYDKPRRLNFYRQMAKFPEVADAIDEICEACLNYDDKHNYINIHFKDDNLKDEQKEMIRKEFERFISLFDFENDAFEIFRDFTIDGEVTWENIIDEKHKELGIIGVNRIPPECYEYLVDDRYNVVGIAINAQLVSNSQHEMQNKSNGELNGQGFNNLSLSYSPRSANTKIIPMPITQITLTNSGTFSETKDVVYPILERARRAYRQLSLIEDAIIIYRLIRAPERLVFNVDTGKLPPSRAEELVLKMMKRYQNKKVYDPSTGTTVNGYDTHSMLENFWFPKPEGSTGSSVASIAGGMNLGTLDDLNYFLRKLYVSLKLPYNRFAEQTQEINISEKLNYEEYRFAKFIIRVQQRISSGLMESFRTHLKLVGIYDQYKLTPRSFVIKFVAPTTFELYNSQRLIQLKMETYVKIADREEFSKEIAMMKILNWTEEEIEENFERLEKEALRKAKLTKKIEELAQTPSSANGSSMSSTSETPSSFEQSLQAPVTDLGDLSPDFTNPSDTTETPATTPSGSEPPEEIPVGGAETTPETTPATTPTTPTTKPTGPNPESLTGGEIL